MCCEAIPSRLASDLGAPMNSVWWALGLVLVLEGLLPFAWPQHWRRYMQEMLKLQDGQLRFAGLFALSAGLLLMWWAA